MSNHIEFIRLFGIDTVMLLGKVHQDGRPFNYCYSCAWAGHAIAGYQATGTGEAVCPKCNQGTLELRPEEGAQLLHMIEDIKSVNALGGKGGLISKIEYLSDIHRQNTQEYKDLVSLKSRIKPIRLLLK